MPSPSPRAARVVRSLAAVGAVAVVLGTCARPAPPAPAVAAAPVLVEVPSADTRIPIPRAAPVRVDMSQAGIPSVEAIPLHHRPSGGKAYAFMGALNEIGQRHRLPVTGTRTTADGMTWLRVMLPHQDFGDQAWVPSDQLRLIKLREKIVVDLSSFTLRHYRNGKLVHRFRVAIGRPEYPTPLGTYFIMGKLQQGLPNGPYGVYTLGTSAFSPVINDGRVGIHGTADPSDPGLRVSHGCIRVYNPDMVKLKGVPLGTPLVFKR
jgi:lipoprotein-anchoring transpeptidase ErfK/SrfK